MATLHEYEALPLAQRVSLHLFRWTSSALVWVSDYERRKFNGVAGSLGAMQTVIPLGSNVPAAPAAEPLEHTVVYFGQIRPNKGLEEFLQLAMLCRAANELFHFHVLGSATAAHKAYAERLQSEADSRVQWSFDLPSAEIAEELSRSWIAYLPFPDGASERRGSLLAAMLNGVPVISRAGPATTSSLADVFLEAQTPAHAFDLLQQLSSKRRERERMSQLGRQYAGQYAWENVAEQHATLYRALVRDRRSKSLPSPPRTGDAAPIREGTSSYRVTEHPQTAIVSKHSRTYYSLQAGRGIAALMVVLFHIGNFVGNDETLWHKTRLYQLFYPGLFGVDFFFILSGIVMFTAHSADIGHPERLGNYLWKRFRRIYPIYWLFLIPTVLKQLRITGTHGLEQRNPFVILSSFLLVHIHSLGINLVVSWTLFHEVLFYAVFALLLLNRLGWLVGAAWLAGCMFFFSAGAFLVEPHSYLEMLFSPLHLLFAFGMAAGWLLQRPNRFTGTWVFPISLMLYAAAIALQLHVTAIAPWCRILAGLALTAALVGISEQERQNGLQVPRLLLLLGDASYAIYLSHFMVVWMSSGLFYRVDQRLHLPIAIWTVLLFTLATAVGVGVHLWIERPLLQVMGALRFRRPSLRSNGTMKSNIPAAQP